MKTVILTLVLLISNAMAQNLKPEKGLYVCKTGNEESICDQILKPTFSNAELTAISVEYVGWCGSMGPYSYRCQGGVCENEGLKFEFKDARHYRWENKQYAYFCDFEKKEKESL